MKEAVEVQKKMFGELDIDKLEDIRDDMDDMV